MQEEKNPSTSFSWFFFFFTFNLGYENTFSLFTCGFFFGLEKSTEGKGCADEP